MTEAFTVLRFFRSLDQAEAAAHPTHIISAHALAMSIKHSDSENPAERYKLRRMYTTASLQAPHAEWALPASRTVTFSRVEANQPLPSTRPPSQECHPLF